MKYSEFVLRELTAGRLSKPQALQLLRYSQTPVVSAAQLHPLLHRNTSDFSGQRFSSTFSGDEFFLRDHVVAGRRMLPGVACLEMAREAVARSLDPAVPVVELRDVTWQRPVVAADGVGLDIDIELATRDDGGIEFDVCSADGATVHVQGLAVAPAPAAVLPAVDIAGLRARCDRAIEASACYGIFSAAGVEYGPAHRGLTEVHRGVDAGGAAFVLAQVSLPAGVAGTRADYALHPSVLDSALQAAVALALGDADTGEASLRPMLPFALERLQIADRTPDVAWVHIRVRGGVSSSMLTLDVDVCDESGRVCVRLQGLTSRVLGEAATETALLTPRWEARPAVAGLTVASTHWVCVDAVYAAQLDALRAGGDATQWLALPPVVDAQTLGAAWEAVFARVQASLASQPTAPVTVQVLVAQQGEAWGEHHGALLGAVSGLLKSAALENPLFRGQVIELAQDADAAVLLTAVRENAAAADAQVRYRGRVREVSSLARLERPAAPPVPWRDGGVYWITGGTGGLGLIVAADILRHTRGARLVLTGRSALDAARRDTIEALVRSGRDAQVEYRVLDVGDAAAVQACADAIVAQHGGVNVLVHSAGVIEDAFILRKTVDQLRAVWTAKVSGTVNLDVATRALGLEGFVLFSSIAGVAGGVGQSDYATANAFLDGYARYRADCVRNGTAQGRTLVIDWPLWADGGMQVDADALDRLRQDGWVPLGTAEGLSALHAAWASDAEQVVVLNGTRAALQAPAAADVKAGPAPVEPATVASSGIDADDLRDRTIRYLRQRLAQTLKLVPERIDPDAPLERYGIDSILSIKLVNALQEAFGALPKTLMFEYQTIAALAQYFLQQHRATLLTQLRVETRPAAALPAPTPAVPPAATAAVARPRRGRRYAAVPIAAPPTVTPIAIVGMSGRYPQAPTLEAYWQNLKDGKDGITEIPASRWDYRDYFDAEKGKFGKIYTKWGGFIDGVELFDALFFNISPHEAQFLDPQERLFLQCAYETLEDAGYTRESLRGEIGGNVGVFVGVMYEEYQLYGAQAQALGTPYALGGSAASIANRVSYYCNLQGPSLALDTMCSSSLTAIHLACRSLRSGECAAAIAGGVNVSVHPNKYLAISQSQFASSRGRCESFGADGDGYVPGEGVGAVLLKPLDRALAQGDHVYGVILGSSVNHGGKTNGYTVPNPQAQAQVVAQALQDAGVDARAISYVEAHGTGTSLGDPIEIAGLTQAFAQFTTDTQYCAIGSVKSNIGHLESAAGIAGLAKVLLQMRHAQLVPSLHAEVLNPHIAFEHTPFTLQRTLAPWQRPQVERDGALRELPRTAGLSSFGAGGANAHLIVQEYVDEAVSQPSARPALVVLSARSEERLVVQVQRLLQHLQAQHCAPHELADLAYTLQVGREAMEYRVAFIATSLPELVEHLQAYLDQGTQYERCYHGDARRKDAVALFGNDEELEQALAKWVERGKYGKLLELWVQGLVFDWRLLHTDRRPRRLALPTYPFAEERYWATDEQKRTSIAAVGALLHPLLHQNTSDLEEQRFSSRFTGTEFYLSDHRVQGQRMMPAVAYLEMGRAAIEYGRGKASTGALMLRHVFWSEPLRVSDAPVVVHTALYPQEGDQIDYEIYSEAEDAERVVYSQGSASRWSPGDAPTVDLDALRATSRIVPGEQCYERHRENGLEYLAAQRSIEQLHVGTDEHGRTTVLATLVLPASLASTASHYVLHPSLMDGALQAIIGFWMAAADDSADGVPERSRTLLPFALESLQIWATCGERVFAVVHERADTGLRSVVFDIDVCDESGRVCVRLQGLTSRVLGEAATETALLTPRWEARPAVAGLTAASTHWVCVDAAYAAQLDALRAGGDATQWLALPPVVDAQTLGAAWEAVFARVQAILASQPTAPVTVQVLVAQQGEAWGEHHGALLGAVSGLLKSAALENPLFRGQVIELAQDADAAVLLTAVRENAAAADAQVRYRGRVREVSSLARLERPAAPPVPWRDGGVYWITGGTGGLGLIVAADILRHTRGARLVLTGRSALDAARRDTIEALVRSGRDAQVEYRVLDVGDAAAVQACADAIVAQHGGVNVLVHSAGVIEDAFILRKTVDQLRAVWTAKVSGTVNLDMATRALALEGFVLFSSIAGVAGGVGQSDYATANAFLDGYARYRADCVRHGTAQGRTLAIDWPLWADGGMQVDADALDRLRQDGWVPLGTAEGLSALHAAWASDAEQVVVLNGTRAALQAPAAADVKAGPAPVEPATVASSGIDADDLRDRTIRYLRQRLAQTLKLAPERIDPDAPLERYGIDSILSIKLVNALQEAFGALPKTLMFEYQTIAALAQYFLQQHRARLLTQLRVETRPAAALPAPTPAATAAVARPRRGRRYAAVPAAVPPAVTPIAIVGMSGRYPQAPTLEAYWQNLKDGKDSITEIPASRWDYRDYFDAEKGKFGKSYTKWGGFIDGVELFDALFFNISPHEAQVLDPQERLFLQCAYETLEDAGYTRESLRGETGGNVGVFVGVMYEEYQLYGAQAQALGTPYALGGSAASIANRVSYYCNLQGPSLALDTMCSSSLTAIHLACRSLRSGECAAAIAGGVNVSVHPNKYLAISQAQFASSRGRCESFGADGDGYVPGEGVGAVLLKPLDRALAQGDHVYGVILGSSVNHGGKTNGYTVPNPQAQAQVVAQALQDAGVDARAISYVEAHGTGTSLGDPIEIAGLTQAFAQFTTDTQYCAIGSVKSNIGHLESAAGIAGLAKVLLQMRHAQLVPSLHAEVLNPHIAFEHTPFTVQRTLAPWQRPQVARDGALRELPRTAGLSSFGAGGANAHLIVQEYVDEAVSQPSARPALVVLSARSEERLVVQVQRLLQHLQAQHCAPHELADLAYTLQVGREAMEYRVAFIATSLPELVEHLQAYLDQGTQYERCYHGDARRKDAVALFGNDEELLEQALTKWVERGKYGKLLELWVQGLAFDWRLLHTDRRPRRLALPTYPFAAERHWAMDEQKRTSTAAVGTVGAQLHPLLHRNTSDFSGQRFSSTFSGDEFFLRDHVVAGRRMLPGVACLEMAREAVARSLDPAVPVVELRDVTWQRPVVAADGVALDIDIELATRDDGGIEFDVCSADGATVHVQGLAVAPAPAPVLPVVDIAGLRARCDRAIEASACYGIFSAAGVEYGPAHRGLTEVHRGVDAGGAAFVLAQVSLPAGVAGTRADYALHPSVLDSALQAAVALAFSDAGEGEGAGNRRPMLPFALERLQIAARTPDVAWVHIRVRGGVSSMLTLDIDVCDESGRVCVRLQGLTSRVLGEAATETALLTPRWEARPAVAGLTVASTHWVCVDAAYAAQLDALRAGGDATQWLALPPVVDAQTLGAAWEAVFARVQASLASQPTAPVTVQVLVAQQGEAWGPHQGALLGAVSGLLKSAALENPLFRGQVIELAQDADAAVLLTAVRENAAAADAQVRYRGRVREVSSLARLERPAAPPVPWRDGGVYWITGGTGGLGLIVAADILRHTRGARLVLTGRSALDAARRDTIEALVRSGRDAQVEYRVLDVGDAAAVQACADAIVAQHGGVNVLVHSAGVIEDAFILRKTVDQLRAVWTAKVSGTVNLDVATRALGLEGFVLFSSIAGVAGGVGQSDYATANAFLDGYARYRADCVRHGTAQGRTLVIDWPLWADGGMQVDADALDRLRQDGWVPLGTAEGLSALHAAWASDAEQVVVLNGTRAALQAPAEAKVEPAPVDPATVAPSGIDADDLRDRTIRYLRQRLAQTLKLAPERIDPDAPLERYGIDSILSIKLVNALQEAFGALPKTLMFEYQTIAALAQYFLQQHRATLLTQLRVETRPAAALPAPTPAATAAVARPRRGRRSAAVPAAAAPAVIPIAIVGMSGRYPQAPTLEAYWQNLKDGKDSITEIPASRWDYRDYFDAEKGKFGKSYTKWGGFIDGVELFDALFFNISPREAQLLDPQERLFLQCAYETLEDAGYTRESLHGETGGNVGVFVGVMYEEYQLYGAQAQALGTPLALGGSTASIANRVSYYCNLRGPSLTLNTMCSSSLTAIHLACRSLRSGECAAAIAGGVNVSVHPNKYLAISLAQFASSRGRCESFGADGDGYVPGEGVGAVLLKPLDRALAQGDHVYGVILGSSVNHGGKTNGYTVPNPQAQAQVVAQALQDAGVDARAISYVEAHGTGTSLGDPIEIAGLTQAFAQFTTDTQYCAIGSVKSNIGHLESAAGIAGLAKVLLQMRHAQLVPSLHAEVLNPHIAFEHTPFTLQRTLAPWQRPQVARDGALRELPRTAGLSSFGAGGANAHLIVQEYVDEAVSQPSARPALVVLSARSEERLVVQVQRLLQHLQAQHCAPHELADLAYTLQVGREAMEYRVAFIATSLPELVEHLQAYLDQGTQYERCYHGDARRKDAVALFGNDEELEQALAKWVERGKYGKLLELWVQGLAFDWRLLHTDRRPRRLALPTYPFAEERYWIPSPPPLAAAADQAPPIRRRKRFLLKQWQPDVPAVERRSGQHVLIVSSPATRPLALALQAHFDDSELLDIADQHELPPDRLAACDGFIDLVGCGTTDGDDLAWLPLLQSWVQARAASGGTLLCVTRGLESCRDAAVDPAGALRVGFSRMLQSEYSRIVSRHLDLDAAADDASAQQISDEYFTRSQDAQVCRRAGERFRAVLEEAVFATRSPSSARPPFTPDGVLWITGGTRGLGYLCARHFVRNHGVKMLLLTCREPLPERASWEVLAREENALGRRLRDLLVLEAEVAAVRVCDLRLNDADAVATLIADVNRTLGPIAGFIHCAGRVDVATPAFVRKRADDVVTVLEPKVAALPVLFDELQRQPLRFAVLFSSVCSIVPSLAAGQSDYAAANAFMDAYAEAKAQQGVPVVSIQWPNWAQSGMGAVKSRAYERSGFLTLDDDEGIALLDEVLAAECRGTVLPAWVDEQRWNDESLAHRNPEATAGAPRAAALPDRAAFAGAEPAAIHDWLRDLVADHLAIERSRIRLDAPLTDYGVDSVMLAQLLSPISRHVGEALDPSILYEHPTIDAFGGWLMRRHGDKFASAVTPAPAAQERPPAPSVVTLPPRNRDEQRVQDIAVVGLSCRFAGCHTPQEYWSLLCEGRSAIAPVPDARWGVACDAHAALLDDLRRFDSNYFRLSPADARAMDPQALLVLEEALKTWHDAGYTPAELRGTATGVYLGARSQHRADAASVLHAPNPILATGQNFLAANVSQFFDLRGPSLVVDAACSSALVAMDVAIQALQSGRTTAALVGGVNVLHTEATVQLFKHRGLLQADGRFHVFDRRAGGAILGEGVGMVLLKTLEQAQADGDRIYAVIKALELNNDGRTAGPSAPNVQAQIDVMRGALRRSGLAASAITHIEANGAGAEVSDLLELKAVAAVYGSSERVCELGSMKPNIGHPLCAEGIASFIKVVLMLHHRRRVPFLSAQQPLQHFDTAGAGLGFCRGLVAWDAPQRAAAINSFADGGTNAHAIVQAFDPADYVAWRRPLDPPLLNRVDLDAVGPVTTVVPIRAASAPRNFWKRTNADGH